MAGAIAAGAAGGATLFVWGVPALVSAIGYTATGIAGSSLAATMMSGAALANGGGVLAGSLVAVLQSIGAAGMSAAGTAVAAATGAAAGAGILTGIIALFV